MADFNSIEPEDGGGSSVAISTATPQALGSASAGSTGEVSDAAHVHAHGDQAGGTLHATAVASGAAGFLSGSDKAKLDKYPSPGSAGRILYDDGTNWVVLAAGSANQILQSNGAGAPSWVAAPTSGGGVLMATTWDGGITTSGKYPSYDGVQWGASTAVSAMRRVVAAGSSWKLRASITGATGSGNTVKFEIQTSSTLGGTFSADAASAITFTNSDGANAIKTGATFTVGGSAVIITIRAIATGADYGAPNQASVQLEPA